MLAVVRSKPSTHTYHLPIQRIALPLRLAVSRFRLAFPYPYEPWSSLSLASGVFVVDLNLHDHVLDSNLRIEEGGHSAREGV